jgi:hypothetical protein
MSVSRHRMRASLFRRLAPAAGAALFLILTVPVQGPAISQDVGKPLTQDVTVTVKLVQAYVTAKDGKPVTDLAAEDFEVTDNGQAVPVTHFEKHFVGGDQTAPPPPSASQVRTSRKFFLFFDFAFVDARSALKARDAGLEFIDIVARDKASGIGAYAATPVNVK